MVGTFGLQRLATLLVLALSLPAGCMRAGFVPEPTDSGPGIDGPASDVLAPAGLDGDCEEGNGCVDPLVCTGLPGQRICRPPCSDDTDCGDGERCGQPVSLQGQTLPVPRACLSVSLAKRYEPCGVSPSCESPLACINMPGESFWTFCGAKCLVDGDCQADEDCEPNLLSNGGLCARRCTNDSDCPGKLRCTGIGKAPRNGDYCLSNNPAATDQRCDGDIGVWCGARHRCLAVGVGAPGMCVPFCEQGQCGPGRVCYPNLVSGREYCLRSCDPLGAPCPAGQVCVLYPPTLSTFCIAGEGLPEGSSCDGDPPCAHGSLCVNKRCRLVCKSTEDCAAGESCEQISSGGKALPWRACLPPSA